MTPQTEADMTFTVEGLRAARLDALPPMVTYGDWEPVYRSVTRQKATRIVGAIFPTVIEWTTVEEEEIVGWTRNRFEKWYEGGRQMGRRTVEEKGR